MRLVRRFTEVNMGDNEDRRQHLTTALQALGWRGIDLARRLGTSPITVSSWRTGRRPVPGYAIAYLVLAVKLTNALEGWQAPGRRRLPDVADG